MLNLILCQTDDTPETRPEAESVHGEDIPRRHSKSNTGLFNQFTVLGHNDTECWFPKKTPQSDLLNTQKKLDGFSCTSRLCDGTRYWLSVLLQLAQSQSVKKKHVQHLSQMLWPVVNCVPTSLFWTATSSLSVLIQYEPSVMPLHAVLACCQQTSSLQHPKATLTN